MNLSGLITLDLLKEIRNKIQWILGRTKILDPDDVHAFYIMFSIMSVLSVLHIWLDDWGEACRCLLSDWLNFLPRNWKGATGPVTVRYNRYVGYCFNFT